MIGRKRTLERPRRLNDWILNELRRGILVYFSVSLFVILIVSSYLTLRLRVNSLLEANYSFAMTQVRNLQLFDYTRVSEELLRFSQSRSLSYAEVRDKFGVAIGKTKSSFEEVNFSGPRLRIFDRPGSEVSWVDGTGLGSIEIRTNITEASAETLGNLTVIVSLITLLGESLITTGFFGLILLSLYLYSAYSVKRAARFVSEPLEEMSSLLARTEHWESLPRAAVNSQVAELNQLYSSFRDLIVRLKQSEDGRIKSERLSAIGRLAAQISHDIRSPLAALDTVIAAIKTNQSLTEDQRFLIRSASARIRDIANNLLEKNSEPKPDAGAAVEEPPSVELVASLVHMIVSEKRMQYLGLPNVVIEADPAEGYGLFVRVQPHTLKRVLSNLINNSVEAVQAGGNVHIRVQAKADQIVLCVSDNGKGIAPEILPRLMQRGETHGKKGGHGLGLYHARQSVEAWAGKMEINSRVGKGTEVVLTLPQAEVPAWFASSITLKKGQKVVIADDDPSIHQIWEERLSRLSRKLGFTLHHFSAPKDVAEWQRTNQAPDTVFLVDYEFIGSSAHGLDLIQELGIAKQSYLVTGRYEETSIRELCLQLGVRLIPKDLAISVPIRMAGTSASPTQPPELSV